MSVIVKGMKMPKCCRECRITRIDLKCYCGKTVRQKEWKSETRPDWCPLVALPDKHGRLVDADAIVTAMNDMKVEGEVFVTAVNYVKLIMNDADTIVEAEDSE